MMLDMTRQILHVSQQETFGQRLRLLREARGLTQTELAEVFRSSQRAICSYEQDRTEPPLAALPQIAAALNVSLDQLMGRDGGKIEENKKFPARWTRKLEEINRLPERKQRTIMQVIDMALKSAVSV
jgi:transcriptional regulator with XRE-family HTH domain